MSNEFKAAALTVAAQIVSVNEGADRKETLREIVDTAFDIMERFEAAQKWRGENAKTAAVG